MQVIPVYVPKEIGPSDDLPGLIAAHASLRDGDVVVVAQKIVSKQEGRTVPLSSVTPSLLSEGIASQYQKDPRLVELILSESRRIVRMRDGVIIVETHSGLVCANAGIDQSNVKSGHATLLPVDSDGSARRIRAGIREKTGMRVAVIVSDTLGRPLRMGQTNCAIGISGMGPILDYAGKSDSFGNVLRVTAIAVSDEIASAAELVMAKSTGCPVAVVRGYAFDPDEGGIDAMTRPNADNLFG